MRSLGGRSDATPLLIIFNPRSIDECMEAFNRLDVHKVFIRNLPLAAALEAANIVIGEIDAVTYVLTSDDVVVSREAFDAVVEASTPDVVATGWCPLDETSDLVNLTRAPLRGDSPGISSYDFFTHREVVDHPADPVPTGFAGMGLTAIHRAQVPALVPLDCFRLPDGRGYSSDFHITKKCERAGIPIVAPKAAFIRHIKERWNELDKAPDKRLLIGEREPDVIYERPGLAPMTLTSTHSIYKEVVLTDRIATEDIVERNEAGQNVVVVPKGQPIPEGVDVPKSKSEPAQDEPVVEDKAVRSSRATKRKK